MVSLLLSIIYLSFISLGLPDSVLGSAWPSMYGELGVPVSYAGIISMIIAIGTVISSLLSDLLTKKFGAGIVTAVSVCMTAIALMGFSFSAKFITLCLWAIPYGLGAGSVDAALNNYVALHYASRHMSWLHCMWGVGTIIGPNIMGYCLTHGADWSAGYKYISIMQLVLTAVLFISLPLWKKKGSEEGPTASQKPTSPKAILRLPGAKDILVAFFCYCALEQTAMLWIGSYMNIHQKIPAELSASCASIFFVGMTVGRFISGFLTYKFTDTAMIRIGQSLIVVGGLIMLLPLGLISSFIGIVLLGLGCAPIYPCIIHSTPSRFGEENSQAMIGLQMASAYLGTCLMPPLFGLIANHINVSLLPIYILILMALMVIVHERLLLKTEKH